MKNEYNISLSGDQKVLTIREGNALELMEPVVINISGDINTVASYVNKRYLQSDPVSSEERVKMPYDQQYNLQMFYKDTPIVTLDKKNLTISLDVNPQDYYSPKVSGKLSFTEELKQFYINEVHTFNRDQLVKLFRFNKRYFTDPAVHDTVLRAFQNLQLTGKTDLNASSDNRGSRSASFQKELDTQKIPTSFYLTMPIFNGQPEEKFLVEVCLDSAESSVIFWLESVELKELIDKRVDEIFSAQKANLSDFVIVEK